MRRRPLVGQLAQQFYICHSDLISGLGSILELDDAVWAVDAEQDACGALVFTMHDHHSVALLRHSWLQIVQRQVDRLVQALQMKRALTSLIF